MDFTNTQAMKENRVNWRAADVHHTTMLLPGPWREYLKGLISVLNARVLLTYIEAYDEVVLASFSDKQPRLPFTELDVQIQLQRASTLELKEDLEAIIGYMEKRKEWQAEAKVAAEKNDVTTAQFCFAMDYAMSYLIRGAYKMATEQAAGRGLPKEFRL